MKKILCIGASQCLPREGVKYEDTWFLRLEKSFPKDAWISYFTRALSMTSTKWMFNTYWKYYYPNIVIWESGMADCAPRYINDHTKKWQRILYISKKLNLESFIWKQIKKHKNREKDCVYTNKEQFYQHFKYVIKSFISIGTEKIIILKIQTISDIAQKKNPYWLENIKEYNLVLERIQSEFSKNVLLIDPKHELHNDYFLEDGYHINKKGHDLVYNYLYNLLEKKCF